MSEAESILRHCREINRCNQRGGRMLSVMDLIEAGTMTAELAAYCLAAIGGGASFMVGAMPGGAGKTTVMGALLNFVPASVELVPADGQAAISRGLRDSSQRQCFICHEIGAGPYYAYLWDQELRDYFNLAEAGHMLATNLHADTYEQAHDQICRQNDVPESALRRMNLMLFLSVRGDRRRIETVWESDGQQSHRLIYEASNGGRVGPGHLVTAPKLAASGHIIERLISSGWRTIEEVRAMVRQSDESGGIR
jgi:hypothetical protein